jgi:hypothetical protein
MSLQREEWAASLLAGAGSVWFVYAITHGFPRFVQYLPPTGGPTELMGIAILLWLHAKHRRFLVSRMPVFAYLPSAILEG